MKSSSVLTLDKEHPLSDRYLERYRRDCQTKLRASMVGLHMTRRRGQSLEFREHVLYTPGDDIRHVDWRASARHGGGDKLLVRKFVAEEQLTLVISLDTRASMELPEALPKLQIAAWLAEAVAWIALRSGDRVYLHDLFGQGKASIKELRSSANRRSIRKVLQHFAGEARPTNSLLRRLVGNVPSERRDSPPNLRILQPYLPPTAVWLILTDCYFEFKSTVASARRYKIETANAIARQIVQFQEGFRWVILVDLDSWPYEQHLLGEDNDVGQASEAKLIDGPGLPLPRPCDIDKPNKGRVGKFIQEHKDRFLKLTGRSKPDVHWIWEGDLLDPGSFFRDKFPNVRTFRRLFMKEP